MTDYFIYLHSMVLGFMALFVAVIAPSIFQSLEPADAGTLLRRLFPRMFLYGMVLMLAAAGIAILGAKYNLALISSLSAAGFGINAYLIAPKATPPAMAADPIRKLRRLSSVFFFRLLFACEGPRIFLAVTLGLCS